MATEVTKVATTKPVNVVQGLRVLAERRHDHARRCKEDIMDCFACQKNIDWFKSMPPGQLNDVLADTVAPTFTNSLCRLTVDALIERTNHTSKRAKRDVIAAMGLLSGYEKMGGRL